MMQEPDLPGKEDSAWSTYTLERLLRVQIMHQYRGSLNLHGTVLHNYAVKRLAWLDWRINQLKIYKLIGKTK